MKFHHSNRRWMCLPTSFAMVCNVEVADFLNEIGHDGSEILWPNLPEPQKRRAFHVQECIHAAFSLGYATTRLDFKISNGPNINHVTETDMSDLVRQKLQGNEAVVLGMGRKCRHANAWDGTQFFDPSIGPYDFENQYFQPETAFIVSMI